MYTNKTILTCCFIFLLNVFLSGNDFSIEDLNGIWLNKVFIDDLDNPNSYLNNPEFEIEDRRSKIIFGVVDEQLTFEWDEKTKNGFFIEGTERGNIIKADVLGNRVTIIYKMGYKNNDSKIVLEFVSRNLIKVISSPYYSNPNYLSRICDYAKTAKAAGKINNTGVRLRTEPSLKGKIWFNLDLNENVEILGISEEKQIIGDMKAFWYEVRINHYKTGLNDLHGRLDGWVFGAYIDVDNRDALEEKLMKK